MSQNGYHTWLPHNLAVMKASALRHIQDVLKPDLVRQLRAVAQNIVDYVDGNFVLPDGTTAFPVYSGNLRDATGVAVYTDGMLAAYVPTKAATQRQHMGMGGINERNIDGSEYLQKTIQDASAEFSSGLWIVLICAVPYAYHINTEGSIHGRGVGFFDNIEQEFLAQLQSGSSGLIPVGFKFN